MIYVGYQGIGKSSISGNGNIDLESNNFRIDGHRDDNWFKIYCNIAEQLSKQGYNVFISSHKYVRDELKSRGVDFTVICPSLEIKEMWIKRLQDRYDSTMSDKDFRALIDAQNSYDTAINNLLQEKNVIVIHSTNYNLNDFIERK